MDLDKRIKRRRPSLSVDWNLTAWTIALVVTLTTLFFHLGSKVPAHTDTDVRASAMGQR